MKSNRKKWLKLVYVLLASLILTGCGAYDAGPVNTQSVTNQPLGTEDKEDLQNSEATDDTETSSADTDNTDSEVETGDDLSEPTAVPLPTKEPIPTETGKSILSPEEIARAVSFNVSSVPTYGGNAYAVVNGNVPFFSKEQLADESFEYYSPLDSLGRCGTCVASVGRDIMPKEDRGEIGSVKPSGWNQEKYPGLVDGNYLYNRCHLIGFQLTGENANTKNLITGTRYFNVDGMLPFENMVADYVKETRNHVMYRVTPIFEGNNLLASGALMEAYSVEDDGEGICFCVFCYNVQPGVTISYSDGASSLTEEEKEEPAEAVGTMYVLNTNTKKFHYPTCSSAKDIKDTNRDEFTGDRQKLIDDGYAACKRCNP